MNEFITHHGMLQDPLQQVYDDLAKGKAATHFDEVLALKGSLCNDFSLVTHGLKKSAIFDFKTSEKTGSTKMCHTKPKF